VSGYHLKALEGLVSWVKQVHGIMSTDVCSVPAVLQVNNYLKFAMQLFFKPTTAKMLSNLKVGALCTLRACCACLLHGCSHAVGHCACCSWRTGQRRSRQNPLPLPCATQNAAPLPPCQTAASLLPVSLPFLLSSFLPVSLSF
jgi:hypothetical protein